MAGLVLDLAPDAGKTYQAVPASIAHMGATIKWCQG